ncbi:hypothetical protein HHX47_DHR8000349 [Lentinula edodes]|nr:hypothetical protein HHX47_DHR8000349 [Lentinula edodes]
MQKDSELQPPAFLCFAQIPSLFISLFTFDDRNSMASGALPSLPVLTFRKNLTVNDMAKDPSKDEETSIKAVPTEEPYSGNDEKINLSYVDSETFVGDVYEDLRAIDLGDDGKERPIVTANDWSLRLVSLEDDPTLPVWTLRLWFLSIGLSCFGAVLSEIFAFRPQTVYVSQLFLQTAAFILGKIMEELLPGPLNPRFPTQNNAFWRFINPGRFNIKEHVGIVIMSAAATHGALAINIFAADDLFYNVTMNPAIAIFTLLGSQLLGYGLGGMMRGFLVYPTSMVFPNLIPTIQMFDVLHRGHDNQLQKKRVKFFWTLFIIIFFWQWIPECVNAIIFDQDKTSPAFFAVKYRSIFFNVQQLLFFENGTEYDQTLILNDDFTLNEDKLAVVGLPWYTATQTVSKIGASLSFGATITHIIVWHGKELWEALLAARAGTVEDDEGALLSASLLEMLIVHQVYKEVPFWWYTAMFVASMAISIATNYTGESELPWWAFFISVGFAAFFLPIISALYAILCFVPGTEDVARMLGAALVPGRPRANMYFTLYAYNSTEQGRSMTRDLKMGQYTKLPPRVTFTMQCLGAVIGALLNYLIMKIVIASNREILLSVQGTNVWSGAAIQSFNSDAISWGALAKQLYSPSGRYGIVPISILIGLAVPVPFWLLHRKWPKARFDSIITPMITVEIGYLAGGINSSVFNTFLLCIFSQFFIRKYHPRWFRKYNFLLSAALDGGTEVMVFVYS